MMKQVEWSRDFRIGPEAYNYNYNCGDLIEERAQFSFVSSPKNNQITDLR